MEISWQIRLLTNAIQSMINRDVSHKDIFAPCFLSFSTNIIFQIYSNIIHLLVTPYYMQFRCTHGRLTLFKKNHKKKKKN